MRFLPIIVLATAASLNGVLSAPTALDRSIADGSQSNGREVIETSGSNANSLEGKGSECDDKTKKQCKVKKEMDPLGYCDSPWQNPSYAMPCGFWPKKKVCDECHI